MFFFQKHPLNSFEVKTKLALFQQNRTFEAAKRPRLFVF
jgi:hypothetical protein